MADSLPETDGMLQVPAARSSSRTEDNVSNDSRRSSASKDLRTQGSSSAGSPSLIASTVSSQETTTSTFLPPAAHSSSPIPSDTVPPRLPHRHGADISQISTTSPSSSTSRQDYQLSPFSSPSSSLVSARALRSSSHATEPRKHRNFHRQNRSSGAFLLTDQLSGGRHGNSSNHESLHTRSDAVQRLPPSTHRPSIDDNAGGNFRVTHETPKHDIPDQARGSARAQAHEVAVPAASYSPTTASPAASASRAIDLDSAQIVNMALSLSESRRLASRRNASQQLPPRFAPGPDGANSGTRLRQQQQQQQQQHRRSSRTVSPKPERPLSGRFSSSQFPHSQGISRASDTYTLQPAFELLPYDSGGGQNAYHYRFSQSTIARAQKAKDYLELLAQQRRLLELIPPLTPGLASRSRATSLVSPPPTSANAGQPQPLLSAGSELSRALVPVSARLGRPYNPLQYIRNRKVRVRERKTIDGEAQGFGDVNKTVKWVDEVARRAATGQDWMLGGYTLPTFASADANAALQSSPPGSRVTGQGILAKLKRPRTDWNIDPADMIADVYWLEQGDNKKLVEDRHWRRVFPQDSALYRPVSQKTDESSLSVPRDKLDLTGPFPTMTDDWVSDRSKIRAPIASVLGEQYKELELLPEQDQSSTRNRARQKLHVRTFRHRQNPSYHAHGIVRSPRGSFSDTTDSDNDRMQSGRARNALTRSKDDEKLKVSSSDKPLGNAQEKDGNAAATAAAAALKEQTRPGPPTAAVVGATPAPVKILERDPPVAQSRRTETPAEHSLPRGRASLELPAFGPRSSLEYDSSRPTSPELRPFSKEGLGFVPPLGGDLSPPSSRAASPPRHRFERVKSMFRDHSREREREREKDRPNYTVSKGGEDDADLVGVRMRGLQKRQQQQSLQQQDRLDADKADKTPLATVPPAKDLRFTPSQAEKIFYGPRHDNGIRPGLGTLDSHRSHSRISNVAGNDNNHSHHHNRSEEGGPTLRGLFKGGPRIDVMLRSAGSKMSEMLWRREGSEAFEEDPATAAHSSSSSDDDSESEATEPRGRLQKRLSMWSRSPSMNTGEDISRQTAEAGQKHYLDVMPRFGRGSDPVNRPPSRQSARFKRLKPPPIDVFYASPSADDASNSQKQLVAQSSSRRNSSLHPPYQQSKQNAEHSESEARSRRSSRVSGVASSVHDSLDEGSPQLISRQLRPMSSSAGRNASHPRWSMSQPAFANRGSLSRREIARLHAFVYSSAVLAKELVRRANEPKPLVAPWYDLGSNGNAKARRFSKVLDEAATDAGNEDGQDEEVEALQDGGAKGSIIVRGANGETPLTWADIAAYAPDPAEMARRPIKQIEMYPLAAQVLGNAIQRSGASWQKSAEMFANAKMPDLRQRIANVRTRVAVDLSGLARQAADEADEVTHDIMAVQRLQVKRVGDSIEKMLRRRQRRFRWVRRAGWLTVEWLLVGLMWYVWFVVTLARIVLGFGRGVYAGVRWLLWL